MDKKIIKYIVLYVVGLVSSFAILSISALYISAGILNAIAYFSK